MGVQFFHPFLFHKRLDAKRGGGPVDGVTTFIPFIVLKSCLPIAEAADVGLSDGL